MFPTDKYRLVKEALIEQFEFAPELFIEPPLISYEDLFIVHQSEYVKKIQTATLTPAEKLHLELPYSKSLAQAALTACSGTLEAARRAKIGYPGLHIGGGFHHAYPDHGEGFSVFNDLAFAAENLRVAGSRVLIIDADLHQGNGTAAFFQKTPEIFTFSIYQKNIYPFEKESSDLDIPLADDSSGEDYLELFEKGLSDTIEIFNPDFVIYVAGADPYRKDTLGGLSLEISELLERDRIVKKLFFDKIPIAVVLAGGYAEDKNDLIKIHSSTMALFAGVNL